MGKMITFRVSDEEYEIIQRHVIETISMSLSDYCRRVLLIDHKQILKEYEK